MNMRKAGLLVPLALAGGVAIGAAGSAIAAGPPASPPPSSDPWAQMTPMMGGGGGMMGGAAQVTSLGPGMMGSFAPGASRLPGMMNEAGMIGSLDPADRAALFERCDELHDAIHASATVSPAPSGAPQPSGAGSLHDLHHPRP